MTAKEAMAIRHEKLIPPDDPIFKEGWVITLNPCVPAASSAPEAKTSATPNEAPDGESES